jgi:hypothetical protein
MIVNFFGNLETGQAWSAPRQPRESADGAAVRMADQANGC